MSDDCLPLSGIRTEPVEVAPMRLAPGERQSGDGTSLPETPNNLTNVSNEIADVLSRVMKIYLVK